VSGVARLALRAVATAVALTLPACMSSAGTTSPSADATSSGSPQPSLTQALTLRIDTLEGKILFTRAGGKFRDETVYTAWADGSHERRITGFGAACCPRWYPDGSHILMSALAPHGRITTGIVEPDGSNMRKIPLPPGLELGCAQAVSLETDRLACEAFSDRDSDLGIYTVRASDGGDLYRVTHCSAEQDDRPFDFSPDGSRIYFLRGSGDAYSGSLFAVDVDGSALMRVTPRDMPVDIVGNAGGRLSPDGTLIVFATEGVVWTIRFDGSHLTKVFEDPEGRIAITPTWSPDGRMILFGLDPEGSTASVDSALPNDLYVMRADGTRPTVLISSDDWKREPDWVA
jgi:Tol biopolymer transport system component